MKRDGTQVNWVTTEIVCFSLCTGPGHISEAARKEVASQLRKITVLSDAGSRMSVMPSGLLPSPLERPVGSITDGMFALTKARRTLSLRW